jgi:hypothetical protein
VKNNVIERYKEELLRIIPDFYKEENVSCFPVLGIANRKSFFINTEMTQSKILLAKKMLNAYEDTLRSIQKDKSEKDKSKIKCVLVNDGKEDIALRIKQDRNVITKKIATLKSNVSGYKQDLKQHERWVKRCAGFIQIMDKDVLPGLEAATTSPLFRFKFFDDTHHEDDLVDATALSIFSCFTAYLQTLRSDRKNMNHAALVVKEKMESQARGRAGIKKKSMEAQTSSKTNLPKSLEYIRLDDYDEMFYAKIKGKDKEERNPLKLSGQPYQILLCLYNKYDLKNKKASVPIDRILFEAGICKHRLGNDIRGNERSSLHIKCNAVRNELEIAGFDGDCLKVENEHCELYICCSYQD